MTHEQLAARASDGDSRAAERLVVELDWMARTISRDYYLQGGDRDDLHQEARIALHKAACTFRPELGSTFKGFADLCIRRALFTAIKNGDRGKHRPLTFAMRELELDDELVPAVSVIVDPRADQVQMLLDREDLARWSYRIRTELTLSETIALLGLANGMSYEEVAAAAEMNEKWVDNARIRAVRKLERPAPPAPPKMTCMRCGGATVRRRKGRVVVAAGRPPHCVVCRFRERMDSAGRTRTGDLHLMRVAS